MQPGGAHSLAAPAAGPAAAPLPNHPGPMAAMPASTSGSRPASDSASLGQPSSVLSGAPPGFVAQEVKKIADGAQRAQPAPAEQPVQPAVCGHGCAERFGDAAGEAGHEERCEKCPAEPPGEDAPSQATLQPGERVASGEDPPLMAESDEDDEWDMVSNFEEEEEEEGSETGSPRGVITGEEEGVNTHPTPL